MVCPLSTPKPRSLHGDVLHAVSRTPVALTDAALVVVVLPVTVGGREPRSLTAVAGGRHGVAGNRASLLDGRLQILVRLLLDRLCIL